jgi:hypothetical protein
MKIWLKGGLIGAGIGLILAFIFASSFWEGWALGIYGIGILGFPWSYFSYGLVGSIINCFILGVIIGLILRKIKSKSAR